MKIARIEESASGEIHRWVVENVPGRMVRIAALHNAISIVEIQLPAYQMVRLKMQV